MDDAVSAAHNAREFDDFMSRLQERDAADQAYNREAIKAHDEQVALRKWQEKKSMREGRFEKLLAIIWRAYPEVVYAEEETKKSFTISWYDDDDMSELL